MVSLLKQYLFEKFLSACDYITTTPQENKDQGEFTNALFEGAISFLTQTREETIRVPKKMCTVFQN